MHRLTFMVLFFFSLSLGAQTDIASATAKPEGGNEFDVRLGQVNLDTGNLALDIPLYQYSNARGVPPTAIHLRYSSTIWTQTSDGIGQYINPRGGWGADVERPNQITFTPTDVTTTSCPAGYNGTIQHAFQYDSREPNGITHHFVVSAGIYGINCINQSTNALWNPGSGYPTTGMASDSEHSGYYLVLARIDEGTIYKNDGSTSAETPNGNLINSEVFNLGVNVDDMGAITDPSYSPGCFGVPQDIANDAYYLDKPYVARATESCTLSIPSWNGVGPAVSYLFTWNYIPVCSNLLNNQSSPYEFCGGMWAMRSVLLPDGTSYQFQYDEGSTPGHFGQLTGMTLPSGGQVSYTYTPANYQEPYFGMHLHSVTDHTSGTTTIAYTVPPPLGSRSVTQQTFPLYPITVTRPALASSGGQTASSGITLFSGSTGTANGVFSAVLTRKEYLGTSPIEQIDTDYTYPAQPAYKSTTWLETGDSARTDYAYYYPGNTASNILQDKKETINGRLYRTTHIDYLGDTPSTKYVTQYHMTSYPVRVTVSDSKNSLFSETDYTYDEYGASYCSAGPSGVAGVPMLAAVSGVFGHDDLRGSNYFARGNPTTINHVIIGGTNTQEHRCYDTLGNVTQVVDGNGAATQYRYDDSFVDNSCLVTNGSAVHGLVTKVINALGQTTTMRYYSCLRSLEYEVDPNDLAANRPGTQQTFDSIGRPSCTTYTNGGSTCRVVSGAFATTINDKQLISNNGGISYHSITTSLSPYGQIQQKTDDQSGFSTYYTYDTLGRLSSQTIPYRGAMTPGTPTSVFNYDGLNRPTTVVGPDNVISNIKSYSGLKVDTYDGAGIHHALQYDPLGRLSHIDELGSVASPLSLGTDYSYDILDNLTGFIQHGTPKEGPRSGQFTYDSLSRLTFANYPEAGPICFGTGANCSAGYDGNGNLKSKTDARGITTSYSYDALNRLVAKAYSGGGTNTPSACYQYDSSGSTTGIPNAIGRLVGEWTQVGTCPQNSSLPVPSALTWRNMQSYDAIGNVTGELQCAKTPCNNPRPIYFSYDLSGKLFSSTNGLVVTPLVNATAPGLIFSYIPDFAFRLGKVTSNWAETYPSVLFEADQPDGTSYGPFGIVASQLGVGSPTQRVLSLAHAYDFRGRTTGITAGIQETGLTSTTITAALASNSIPYGQTSNLSVQVSCQAACGSVTLSIDGVNSQVLLLGSSGLASGLVGAGASVGQHVLSLTYTGNSSYLPSNTSVNFSVTQSAQPPPAMAIALSQAPVLVGTTPTIVTVIGCNYGCGTIKYYVDGVFLQAVAINADGSVSAPALVQGLSIGTHALMATYQGDPTYGPVSKSLSFTLVSSAPTSLSVGISQNPVPVDEAPYMGAQVGCASCGSVAFQIDGITIVGASINGTGLAANYWNSAPPLGRHILTASFAGNASYGGATASMVIQIVPDTLPQPSLAIGLSSNPVMSGSTPAVIVQLGCTYGCGYVAYYVDGVIFQRYAVLGDGALASPSISSALAVGTHLLLVKYLGDSNYAPASRSLSFNIQSNSPTSISASIDVNPVPVDEAPWMRAVVGCGSCGSVTFSIDGIAVAGSTIYGDGSALNYWARPPAIGTHILTASYPGNATYSAASTSFSFNVVSDTLPKPSLAIAVSSNPVAAGAAPGVLVNLGCSYACGYVSFAIDGVIFQRYAVIFNGAVAAPTLSPSLVVGSHTLSVQYLGDANYAPTSRSLTFVVLSTNPTTLSSQLDVNPVPVDEAPFMRAQVGCGNCGSLAFLIDGVAVAGSTIYGDGSALNYWNTPPTLGYHLLTTAYPGNGTFSAASKSFGFNVVADTLPKTSLTASISPTTVSPGTAPTLSIALGCTYDCGFVTFSMDGTIFQRYEVIFNGAVASPPISTSLGVGIHVVTVKYLGDAHFAPSAASVSFSISAPK